MGSLIELADAPVDRQDNAAPTIGRPSGILERIAADPDLTRHLHEVIGSYCHQVRNQLNSLKLSLYFAQRGGDRGVWGAVDHSYGDMERWLDRLQLICRPIRLQTYKLPFGLLIDERRRSWEELAERRGVTFQVFPVEQEATVAVDPGSFSQALDDFVTIHIGSANEGTGFDLSWNVEGDFVVFVLSDRPPSVRSADDAPTDDRMSGPDLSADGLTFPYLQRLVVLHGGAMEDAADDGRRLSFRLPIVSKTPDSSPA